MKRPITMVVAGLAVVLSAQVGVTARATSTSEVASATQVRVRIQVDGRTVPWGPEFTRAGGRFTLVGATSTRPGAVPGSREMADCGTFRDSMFRVQRFGRVRRAEGYPHGRTLRGGKGTIEITVHAQAGPWTVIGGTGAYAGLRGQGRIVGRYGPTIDQTMIGTVSGFAKEG